MTRVLVTGAGGFIGRTLCRRLVADGETVMAFVRDPAHAEALERTGVECLRVDIRRREEVLARFPEVDTVYHIAAAFRVEHARRDEFRSVNVEGTAHMIEGAEARGVGRFVHCSTVGVHGAVKDPAADEHAPIRPGDHYQQSKAEGEELIRVKMGGGFPAVIARPVGVYGPGDTRFLKLFRVIRRGLFFYVGPGRNRYHLAYIDDLVRGLLLCGRSEKALGETLILAGGDCPTVRELVERIADTLGRPRPRVHVPYAPVLLSARACDRVCRTFGVAPPLYPRRLQFFREDRSFSIRKARRLLGYEPSTGLAEGVRRTADWYRENRLL